MAKDLRSRKSGMGGTKPFAKKPEIDPRQEDFIRRAVEQNQGRDKDDLQKELFERVRAQKQAGQFDPAGLERAGAIYKHTASVEGGVSRRKAGLGFYQSV